MRFCIVGTGRCGSTLLQRMMNLHPDLFVFAETHWIPKMYEMFGLTAAPVKDLLYVAERTTFVTGESTLPQDASGLSFNAESLTVREFCDAIGAALAGRDGKRFWADKTPDYGPYMGLLQSLWPDCRFINLLRNGNHCAISMSGHPGYRWLAAAQEDWWVSASFNHYYESVQLTERPPEAFLGLWLRRLMRIRDEARRLSPGSYLELRFEDLCEQPSAVLARIANFVDLESGTGWLEAASSLVDASGATPRSWGAPVSIPAAIQEALQELGYGPGE